MSALYCKTCDVTLTNHKDVLYFSPSCIICSGCGNNVSDEIE